MKIKELIQLYNNEMDYYFGNLVCSVAILLAYLTHAGAWVIPTICIIMMLATLGAFLGRFFPK
jgi:hypothetical protein